MEVGVKYLPLNEGYVLRLERSTHGKRTLSMLAIYEDEVGTKYWDNADAVLTVEGHCNQQFCDKRPTLNDNVWDYLWGKADTDLPNASMYHEVSA